MISNLQNKYGKWFGFLARLTLGGVLLAAGWLKVFTPAKSQMAVRAYEVLPISVANFFGIALPWLEVGLGILLILGIAVRLSAILGGALMVLFIAAISQAWARGLSIDCGCFGGGGTVATSANNPLPPSVNQLLLTNPPLGINAQTNVLNGRIKKFAYYPVVLTNTQLQSLSAN